MLEGMAYLCLGDSVRAHDSFDSARVHLERVARKRPNDERVYGSLGMTYAALGMRDEAVRAGKRAVELYPVTRDAILGTYRIMDLVITYSLLGEYDAALERMEFLLSIPTFHSIPYFNLSPLLDDLRETEGYQRLVRRYSEGNA
jgi:tetratricopeptide (TPR) repeat protein